MCRLAARGGALNLVLLGGVQEKQIIRLRSEAGRGWRKGTKSVQKAFQTKEAARSKVGHDVVPAYPQFYPQLQNLNFILRAVGNHGNPEIEFNMARFSS